MNVCLILGGNFLNMCLKPHMDQAPLGFEIILHLMLKTSFIQFLIIGIQFWGLTHKHILNMV